MASGDSSSPSAAVLVIGNEILSGRTQDVNVQRIARKLETAGITLREVRVVADDEDAIVAALNALRGQVTDLFTTGGIGPTHDDITAASVAKAFGVALREDPEARARLTAWYGGEAHLNPARLRMALMPEGATLIDNPVSAAPGFSIGNVHVLAGVPEVMAAMLDGLVPRLRPGPPLHTRQVSSALPESLIADGLAAVAARFPEVQIGSYPWFRMGQTGVVLVARSRDLRAVDAAAEAIAALLAATPPPRTAGV